jgi:hypothetical protein
VAVVESGAKKGSGAGAGARVRLGRRPAQPMTGEALARALLRVALVVFLAATVALWLYRAASLLGDSRVGFDFRPYFAAALALRDNPSANIYDPHVLRAAALAHGATPPVAIYLYPPLLAVLLLPLTLLPPATATTAWTLLNLLLEPACIALTLSLLARLPVPRVRWRAGNAEIGNAETGAGSTSTSASRDIGLAIYGLALILSLIYDPFINGIALGQASVAIDFLLLLAPWLALRGHERAAGGVLALAVWLKLFPLALLVYFALAGRWRIVRAALAVIAALGLALVPVIGVGGLLATRFVLSNGGDVSAQFDNEALRQAPIWIATLFGGGPGSLVSALGYLLIAMVAGAFTLGMLRVGHVRGASGKDRRQALTVTELLGYLWALCTMVLVSPITWMHHYVWLLPAFMIGGAMALRGPLAADRRLSALLVIALALGYLCTFSPLPFTYDGIGTFDIGPYLLGQPLRPYFMLLRPLGTLLLWGATGLLYLARAAALPSWLRQGMTGASAAGEPMLIHTPTVVSTRRTAALVLGLLAAVVLARVVFIAFDLALGPGHVVALLAR